MTHPYRSTPNPLDDNGVGHSFSARKGDGT